MKSDIQALRDDVDELQEKVAAILSRIQSITYVPLYSDGKASVDYDYDGSIVPGTVVFDFEIRPASVATDLAQVWETALSMKAVYTITRSALDFVPLDVVSATAQNGILTVTASGSQLKEDFFLGRCSASASLSISDGNNEISSDYIPLIPVPKLVTFASPNFKSYCVSKFDTDGDGKISTIEAYQVTDIDCSGRSITDLTGIEAFTNLKYLNCSENSLTKLDISANTNLVDINVSNNLSLETLVYNDCTINAAGIMIGTYVNVSDQSGVVFYSSENEVKIVSTDEDSKTWDYIGTKTGASSTTDGVANTNIIAANSNAAKWCRAKGPAWYLPAMDELSAIYNNRVMLNSTLSSIGRTQLGMGYYWSSTEAYLTQSGSRLLAYCINFSNGDVNTTGKDGSYSVRAVRAL